MDRFGLAACLCSWALCLSESNLVESYPLTLGIGNLCLLCLSLLMSVVKGWVGGGGGGGVVPVKSS